MITVGIACSLKDIIVNKKNDTMIKYKRFEKKIHNDDEIQEFFDGEITSRGWIIIYYNETIVSVNTKKIVVVCSKKN